MMTARRAARNIVRRFEHGTASTRGDLVTAIEKAITRFGDARFSDGALTGYRARMADERADNWRYTTNRRTKKATKKRT